MKKIINIFIFFTLLSISPAFAHSGDIKGTVTDSLSGNPVTNTDIIIDGSPWAMISNELGEFKFNNIPDGDYVLTVSCLSYTTQKIEITVTGDKTLNLNVQLSPSSFAISEISILGNKEPEKVLTRLNMIDVELRPVTSSQDLLRIVPGLVTAQHAGGGKAEQIYLRGVDNDHGTDFMITVDGMPVNMVSHAHGQGYADLHFLIPEVIDYIEFNKGPYSAEKGNFATTGYANFKTQNQINENELKLEIGKFNTQRVMTKINLLKNTTKHQNLYLASEFLYSDSYFETPQLFKRLNLFAKYNGKVGNNSYLSTSVSTFSSNWNHSGQIPDRAVKDGWISRLGSMDDSEGGFTGRTNINSKLTTQVSENMSVSNQFYYSNYDFQLWSNFTFFLNDTTNGDQIMQQEKRDIFGYNGKLTLLSKLAGLNLKSDFGIGLRYDNIDDDKLLHTYKRNTVIDTFSVGDVNETNMSLYYEGDLNFSDKFVMSLGLRYDYFKFQYINNLEKEFAPYHQNEGILSPKLRLFYNPAPNVQFYIKTGYGFHSNDTRMVVQNQVEKGLTPAISSDMGSFFKLFDKVLMNAAIWTMYMEQEFVYVGDEAVVEPKGSTMRYGTDISIRYQIANHLFFDVDYNYSYGHFTDLPSGENYIPLAPVHTSMGGLVYKSNKGFSSSFRYRYVSDRPANEDNSVVAKGYFLAEAAASYKWKHFELFVRADNLFNSEWNEAQFDTESRLRHPDIEGNFTGALEPEPISELHYTPGYPFNIRSGVIFNF